MEDKELTAKDYYERGKQHNDSGEYEQALEDFNKVIELDENYKGAYGSRGNVYYNLEEYKKALLDYEEEEKKNGELAYLYNNRGLVYYHLKQYDESISEFSKAISKGYNYANAYNNRGSVYAKLQKYKDSISDYNKAIEIDKTYKLAYKNRGVTYEKLEKYEEAISDYSKAIEIDKTYKRAYNSRSDLYKKLNRLDEAEYDKVIADILENNIFDESFQIYLNKRIDDIKIKTLINKLFLSVSKLKNQMIVKDIKPVGHYTKIENLKFFFKPEKLIKDGAKPRLRLNNVAYMNDPTEGEVFLRLLESYSDDKEREVINSLYKGEEENSNGREILSGKNHTFLTSFSEAIDTSLPMWVQYSKDGQGCCLVFKPEFFDYEDPKVWKSLKPSNDPFLNDIKSELSVDNEENLEDKYCLYKIEYIKMKDNNTYELDEEKEEEKINLIKDIIDCIVKIKSFDNKDDSSENKDNFLVIKEIIQNILDQVRYLFKDDNYSHEQELRVIKFEDDRKIIEYTTDAEGFVVPHVYVNIDKDLAVEEVVLGPKVNNTIEISNYLYYTEEVDKVSKSRIKYK